MSFIHLTKPGKIVNFSGKILFLFVFCMLQINGFGSETISINQKFFNINPAGYISYYFDSSNNLTINEIREQLFTPNLKKNIAFGFSKTPLWLRFKIINNTSSSQLVYLSINNHFLEKISLYVFIQDSLILNETLGSRSLSYSKPHSFIPFSLENMQSAEMFLRVESGTPLRIPVSISSPGYFTSHKLRANFINGAFYGINAFLIVLSLIIWLTDRDKMYIYFSLGLIFLLLFQLGNDNYIVRLSGDANYFSLLHRFTALSPLAFFFYILFSERFFGITSSFKWIRISLQTLKILFLAEFILFNLFFFTGNRLSLYIFPIGGLSLYFISIFLLGTGERHIRFFVIANTLFMISLVFHALNSAGHLQSYILSTHGLKIGILAQTMVFTLAVWDRFYLFQKKFSQILESEVEKRTNELKENLNKLKQTQQKLVQSEKLASIAILTRGFAHEVNNPLNFITGGSYFIEKEFKKRKKEQEQNEKISEGLMMIREGTERISNLTNAILSFSANEKAEKKMENLNDILEDTLFVLKQSLPVNLILIKELNLEQEVYCVKSQVHIVVLNVLENAVYALKNPEGESDPELVIRSSKTDHMARVEIRNNGPEIPSSIMAKIFEPFFTTKSPNEGNGLGLSIAANFMRENNGEITMENVPGGVVCIIKLPLRVKQD